MKRIATRTIYTLIVLLLSSIAVFYAIRLSGGDAVSARLPASASYEEREEFRELLGLNDPVHEQYFRYMGRLLTFDLGKSLTNNADIFGMLTEHGKNSLIWERRPSRWCSSSACRWAYWRRSNATAGQTAR